MAVTDIFKKPVFKLDGITLTFGLILVAVLVWYFFLRKRG